MSKRCREPGLSPGHPPAPLTHAVVVLRVRPVARVAMAGVAGGALDALSVTTDVLVQSALICLCRRVEGGGARFQPHPLYGPQHPISNDSAT